MLAVSIRDVIGWAAYSNNSANHGSIKIIEDRLERYGLRYARFIEWLSLQIEVAEVYYVDITWHASSYAARDYGGLLAHLALWCEQRGIYYQGVTVGTIKKHATGKGNANARRLAAIIGDYPPHEVEAIALLNLILDIS